MGGFRLSLQPTFPITALTSLFCFSGVIRAVSLTPRSLGTMFGNFVFTLPPAGDLAASRECPGPHTTITFLEKGNASRVPCLSAQLAARLSGLSYTQTNSLRATLDSHLSLSLQLLHQQILPAVPDNMVTLYHFSPPPLAPLGPGHRSLSPDTVASFLPFPLQPALPQQPQ